MGFSYWAGYWHAWMLPSYFSESFCRMILAGEVGLLVARKMVVTYVCLRCVVSSLNVVRPSLVVLLVNTKVEWWRSKMARVVFVNRFLFPAWDIGFAFGASRLVKGCEYWDEMALLCVDKVEMAACVVGRVRDCVLESPWFLCVWYLGRVCVISIKVDQRWIES